MPLARTRTRTLCFQPPLPASGRKARCGWSLRARPWGQRGAGWRRNQNGQGGRLEPRAWRTPRGAAPAVPTAPARGPAGRRRARGSVATPRHPQCEGTANSALCIPEHRRDAVLSTKTQARPAGSFRFLKACRQPQPRKKGQAGEPGPRWGARRARRWFESQNPGLAARPGSSLSFPEALGQWGLRRAAAPRLSQEPCGQILKKQTRNPAFPTRSYNSLEPPQLGALVTADGALPCSQAGSGRWPLRRLRPGGVRSLLPLGEAQLGLPAGILQFPEPRSIPDRTRGPEATVLPFCMELCALSLADLINKWNRITQGPAQSF